MAEAYANLELEHAAPEPAAPKPAGIPTGLLPVSRPPEPEPLPARAARRDGGRRELPAWITLQIRNEVAAALRRQRDAAQGDSRRELAGGIGQAIAEERATHRKDLDELRGMVDDLRAELSLVKASRSTPAILDLTAEREQRRRAGGEK